VEAGTIFIAEGHFNLKPVLPLDAQEFNPQTGCVAGLNYGDYKQIELSDGKTATGSRAIIRPICPTCCQRNREDAFLQCMAQKNPGKTGGANPSSFTGRDRWTFEDEILTR